MRLSRGGMFRSRSGNTAIIFAILAPVLILAAGGAIDVTNASMRQAQLQQAADAAAVAAVARSSPGYAAAVALPADGPVPDAITAKTAQAIFDANWHYPTGVAPNPITVAGSACGGTTIVCRSKLTVNSKITVTGTFTTAFLGIFIPAEKTINLGAVAYASDNIPAYVDFHLLLDNSPSMALPATSADVTRMVNMTANVQVPYNNCAFACHATDPSFSYENLSTFALSPTDGGLPISTRIQVVRQAAVQLFGLASSIEQQNGVANEFQMAIYDFGAQATYGQTLATPLPLTASLGSASSGSVNSIDVMTVPSENQVATGGNNDEDTDFNSMLTQLYNVVDPKGVTVGDGSTTATPQQVIFLVSDGLDDSYDCNFNDGDPCRKTEPIGTITKGTSPTALTTNECTSIKAKGILIAILYTTNVPLDDPVQLKIQQQKEGEKIQPSWYDQWVWPFYPVLTTNPSPPDQIAQAMQACASAGFYSEVTPDGSIPAAMTALFQKVVASVKLTPPSS